MTKHPTLFCTTQRADANRSATVPLLGCGVSSFGTVIKFSFYYVEAELFIKNLCHAYNTNTYMVSMHSVAAIIILPDVSNLEIMTI